MGNSYIGPYVVQTNLGKGHFGKSRLCQTSDQFHIAAKIIEATSGISKEKLMKDLDTFYTQLNAGNNTTKGRHPLLKYREVVEMDDRCFGVISQYCPQGNLEQRLNIRKQIPKMLLEMKQIAQNVEWLHQKKVTHGDLKPTNILYKDGQLLLSDVMMPAFSHCLRLRNIKGTYDYFPPEHFSALLSPATDIWALGIIFLEIFYGKRIRQLQQLDGVLKPSLNEDYPSQAAIASITHLDLRSLIASMLRVTPHERITIQEVLGKLQEMISPQLRTIRNMALRIQDVSQAKKEESRALPLVLNIDHTTPYFKHFTISKDKIKRLDGQKIRLQVISREKIPLGVWSICVSVLDYGQGNEEIVIGFTTQERRKQKMSGDIDQGGSLAYWSNKTNCKGNLCLNGIWKDHSLPFLRQGKGILQLVADTEHRSIHWYVDSQWVQETSMPRGWWDQSLYFFMGLMGKNCTMQFVQPFI